MNKRVVLGLIAAIVVCGCQIKEEKEYAPEGKSFAATTEVMVDNTTDSATKTSLDATGNVLWKQGDQVSIFAGSTTNGCYQVTDASVGKTAAALNPVGNSVSTDGEQIPNNVAFYPYSSDATIAQNGSTYVISDILLPATQEYAQKSFGNGAFPMVAVTSSKSDYNLKFKNVLGGLKLQLKGTATIASIIITGNNNERICGAARVTVSEATTPAISLTDATAKTVTMDCGDGVQLDAETATAFIITIPPMTMTGGFTVTVTDTENKQMEIKTTRSQTITRSNLLSMPAVTFAGLDPHSQEESDGITPIWSNGEEYVSLTVSSKSIFGSVSLNVASIEHSDDDITEGITAVLSDSGMTIAIDNVQATILGDVLAITLSHDNVENISAISDQANLEITLATGEHIILPCHGSLPASVYFNTPVEGFDEGIILETGEYALMKANVERGGWDLIVGVEGDDPLAAWIDETGLFRMLSFDNHTCVFEFHENAYDIIWSGDDEPDVNIPYPDDTIAPAKTLTKAGEYSLYQNGDLYASLEKLGEVLNTVDDASGLKPRPWRSETRYKKKVARFGVGLALLLCDTLMPEEWEVAHDAVAILGLVASIFTMNPVEIGMSAWEVGSIAVQRYYFGYATLKTLAVTPINTKSANCMAAMTITTGSYPWQDSRSSEVEFIVTGADSFEKRQSTLMESDTTAVVVNGLKPGGHYSLQTRMYRVWIHNNNSHKNFGLRPEDFKKDLTPFNERIDRSWVSLYGGEVFFTMPMPGAETGEPTSITVNSAVLSCSFTLAEGFTCGVMISSDDNVRRVSASPSSTSVSVGGLDPMTTYTYWAYVEVDGIPINGVTKSFTTGVPSLEGTWTWTEYYTDNAGNRRSEQFSITLSPDMTITDWDPKRSYESGDWYQSGRRLSITIIGYNYNSSYGWFSGGWTFNGNVTDNSFNKVVGYCTTWRISPNSSSESARETILER